jgi:imidazolonepropionase-like amidohydrolase
MRIIKLLVLLILFPTVWIGSTSPKPRADLGIIAGTLIDGTGGTPRHDVLILVQGGEIQAVVPKSELSSHPVGKLIDASDKYVIPGLFDMHGHLTMTHRELSREGDRLRFTVTYHRDVAEWMLRHLLFYGVTTVRETGDLLPQGIGLKKELMAGSIPGPRIFACGPLLEAPPPLFQTMSAVVAGEVEAKVEIDRQAKAGVDFVKIYATVPPNLTQVLVEAAHAHSIRVLAHLGATTWKQAAELGVDAFVHANPTPRDILDQQQLQKMRNPDDPFAFMDAFQLFDPKAQAAQELFSLMRDKGIANDPTLVVFRNMGADPGFLSEEQGQELKAVPSAMMAGWKQELSSKLLPMPQDRIPMMMRFVKAEYDGGVTILAGSDFANPNTIAGLSLHQELELLVKAGIPPLTVLKIATHDAASWLRILDKVGTLEPGKRADAVILNRDPLTNIRNTRDIFSVIQAGNAVDRGALNH